MAGLKETSSPPVSLAMSVAVEVGKAASNALHIPRVLVYSNGTKWPSSVKKKAALQICDERSAHALLSAHRYANVSAAQSTPHKLPLWRNSVAGFAPSLSWPQPHRRCLSSADTLALPSSLLLTQPLFPFLQPSSDPPTRPLTLLAPRSRPHGYDGHGQTAQKMLLGPHRKAGPAHHSIALCVPTYLFFFANCRSHGMHISAR